MSAVDEGRRCRVVSPHLPPFLPPTGLFDVTHATRNEMERVLECYGLMLTLETGQH